MTFGKRSKRSLGFFLRTPKSELKGFTKAADREYYSRPRKVELLHTQISTGLVTVREPVYGIFPADPARIREEFEWV